MECRSRVISAICAMYHINPTIWIRSHVGKNRAKVVKNAVALSISAAKLDTSSTDFAIQESSARGVRTVYEWALPGFL